MADRLIHEISIPFIRLFVHNDFLVFFFFFVLLYFADLFSYYFFVWMQTIFAYLYTFSCVVQTWILLLLFFFASFPLFPLALFWTYSSFFAIFFEAAGYVCCLLF